MRNGLILAGVAFAVALAYIVGSRLSNEAVAVVVGAVCGISASIPVSIALVIASGNNWGRREETPPEPNYGYDPRRYAPQPPVIFIAPPQPQMPYGYSQTPYNFPAQSAQSYGQPREFKIIGEE